MSILDNIEDVSDRTLKPLYDKEVPPEDIPAYLQAWYDILHEYNLEDSEFRTALNLYINRYKYYELKPSWQKGVYVGSIPTYQHEYVKYMGPMTCYIYILECVERGDSDKVLSFLDKMFDNHYLNKKVMPVNTSQLTLLESGSFRMKYLYRSKDGDHPIISKYDDFKIIIQDEIETLRKTDFNIANS